MASRLTPKEERVLSQVNQRNKERDVNVVGQTEQTPSEHFHQTGGVHNEDAQPGVIGSLIKTVQGTIGQTKDAVMGKSTESAADYTTIRVGDAAAKAREKIDAGYTVEKAKAADTIAGEFKDTAAKKAKTAHDTTAGKLEEYKDYTAEKAKQAKDTVVEKAGECKDYTAGKAVEGKDDIVGKMTELKDSSAGAARRAMDYLTGKKVEDTGETVKQKTGETAQEKYEETEEDDIKDKLTPQLAEKMEEQGPCGGNGEAKAENRLTADQEYILLFGSILVLGS